MKLLLILLIGGFMAWPQSASAHVLLKDDASGVVAVFHSNPDDDPIAGENTELYFDIQSSGSQVRIPTAGYEVVVRDTTGSETVLPVNPLGNTARADYTFPRRGVYDITLRSQASYDQFQKVNISSALRVDRGVGAPLANDPRTEWQIAGFAASGLVALLGITFYNNRREILAKSSF